MSDIDEKINLLQARLDKMVEYQNYFYREINQIREEIKALNQFSGKTKPQTSTNPQPRLADQEKIFSKPPISSVLQQKPIRKDKGYQSSVFNNAPKTTAPVNTKSNLEEFVGRNLISLIGIIITILGVGIGAKYAIDRDLISPATRIFLGYAFAGVLLAIAVWLKKKYLNFSAVLMSGALAMMYFLTFFAYSFYGLIPQRIAFLMMLFFTAFTVVAAINYNRQIIAHIGLVGAYAVPFLLSENSGRVDILFSYITIINFGILAISVKKFWKPLYYSSFIFTWLIFTAWYFSGYRAAEHFTLSIAFTTVFFLTFYLTFLSYKLIAKEKFNLEIVILVVLNSFIFYGFGYSIFQSRDGFGQFLGIFTIINAAIHFLVASAIRFYKLGDRQNLHLALGLAVTFITIAVPVQFKGNWTTVFWAGEAAYLFWVGRTKRLALYENLSYPLMILASVSLLNEWQSVANFGSLINAETTFTPFFNRNFITSISFVAAFAFIYYVNSDRRFRSEIPESVFQIARFAIPTILLVALYNTFRVEIGNYFHYQLVRTAIETSPQTLFENAVQRTDRNLSLFNAIWQINYSMAFLSALAFLNIRKIKSDILGFINLALNALMLFIFLTAGLYLLGDLRTNYLLQIDADAFQRGVFGIFIRYISYTFVAFLIWSSYQSTGQEFLTSKVSKHVLNLAFDFAFYFALLWIASSELINWMDIFGFADSYKLGLSILWGIYALGLIIIGIVKRKKHLRIGAIALFALTLVKLFFYDIADLDTISKTVVFVSLGVLLLIISFLYNKYKDIIFEESKN